MTSPHPLIISLEDEIERAPIHGVERRLIAWVETQETQEQETPGRASRMLNEINARDFPLRMQKGLWLLASRYAPQDCARVLMEITGGRVERLGDLVEHLPLLVRSQDGPSDHAMRTVLDQVEHMDVALDGHETQAVFRWRAHQILRKCLLIELETELFTSRSAQPLEWLDTFLDRVDPSLADVGLAGLIGVAQNPAFALKRRHVEMIARSLLDHGANMQGSPLMWSTLKISEPPGQLCGHLAHLIEHRPMSAYCFRHVLDEIIARDGPWETALRDPRISGRAQHHLMDHPQVRKNLLEQVLAQPETRPAVNKHKM